MTIDGYSYLCPTEILVGAGRIADCGDALARLGLSRVLAFVDPNLRNLPEVDAVLGNVSSHCQKFDVFDGILPNPPDTSVYAAHKIAQGIGADGLLAIGGGSCMDTAKAVGILVTNGGELGDYAGVNKYNTPPLPLVAVPTTAGTGSEVSGSCVITNTKAGLKMSLRHARYNPATIGILDPRLLRGVPQAVARDAGVDAFVHAFESFISRNANPITDSNDIEAIRLISGNIRQFVANRQDEVAAEAVLVGATLAGMAFGQTGVGNVHCMARFVGAKYHVAHGLANALCLPVVARFNMMARPSRYARVAAAMGCKVDGLSTLDAAEAAVGAISRMCDDLGVPRHLADVGVQAEDIDELAELCVGAGYNRWNPRDTSKSDFVALFRAAL